MIYKRHNGKQLAYGEAVIRERDQRGDPAGLLASTDHEMRFNTYHTERQWKRNLTQLSSSPTRRLATATA